MALERQIHPQIDHAGAFILSLALKLQLRCLMQSVAPLTLAAIQALPPTPAMRRSRRSRLFEQSALIVPLAGVGIGAVCALSGDRSTQKLGVAALASSLAAL